LKRKTYKESVGRKCFIAFDYVFLIIVALLIMIPLMNILVTSLAEDKDVLQNSFLLVPKSITFEHYINILKSGYLGGFINSLKITILGIIVAMPLTVTMGYALANDKMPARSFWINFVLATMILDGGIIPFYLLIKKIGLMDTHAAVFLPLALSSYNLILVVNYMRSIPKSLSESARVDGASELRILISIILPISVPILSAITLFYLVDLWNNYFNVIMFINKQSKYNIQVMLRSLVIENDAAATGQETVYDNFKMAVMVLGMLPILMVYPFIQKYFVKGIMLGAIKG